MAATILTGVFPQLFDDAIHAWRTGKFEGESVFQAQDPGGAIVQVVPSASIEAGSDADTVAEDSTKEPQEPNRAGIRIDLGRIGGQ